MDDHTSTLLKRYFKELASDPSVHVERGRLYRGWRLLWAPPRQSSATFQAVRQLLERHPAGISLRQAAADLSMSRTAAHGALKAIGAVHEKDPNGDGRAIRWRMPTDESD